MSIVGILANGVSASTGGNIVGDSATLTHHFGSSSIWGIQAYRASRSKVTTSVTNLARPLACHSS
jgi:hypothetical protein